jgi:hypothetical protein
MHVFGCYLQVFQQQPVCSVEHAERRPVAYIAVCPRLDQLTKAAE